MSADPIFPKANPLTEKLFQTLRLHPKRIVFTEGEDVRVVRVAARMVELEIGVPILIGDRNRIRQMAKDENLPMTFISVVDPAKSSDLGLFCERLKKVARYAGKHIADPCEVVSRPHNFAAMMVQYGHADGMVSGNQAMPATVLRAAKTMIKPIKEVPQLFGAKILVAPHLKNFGRDGMLFLADSGVIPEPDIRQLASIAIETGKLAKHFLGRRPRIAMLSHSTHGSSSTESAKKMAAATELARQQIHDLFLDMDIDGEIQADVAVDNTAAEIKVQDRRAQEPSDVLVFPNIDAANISLKLVQHLGGAQNYGLLIMGLTRPAAQVPRTTTEETLLGTAAIVGAEAIKAHEFQLAKK
ncbi:hypothetical protein JIN77_00890 [Verrucomicrobiaceae bacterium R5-34]|uniref:Phosphate acetyl/butaryl transferase domain-containing protein n=1 Tax=Oceaniferula flava TaxID=2800421 RepID=A0AAE2SA08_9BACT|nr:phosphate acyltransferase [Oceaniferula flavus]MBK1829270.1 hypothetical protein [Verrucomicrobiaceae bacterium R5-34]MBK1853507.1 hypothetical protein [Oceaniferula flavus]MBM1134812.1 hypothetical protein [Oceaniferula flavus]